MNIILKAIFIAFFGGQACAEEIKPFDWSKLLEIPPDSAYNEGAQILHFKSKNRHFAQSPEAIQFVKKYLSKSKKLQSDAEVIRFASDAVKIANGAFVEMGVCTGKTVNFIAALNPHSIIYGFDSFEGLPEDWIRQDRVFKKGTFSFKDGTYIPPVLHNVRLYKGWFKESLPTFKSKILKDRPIAFLHIDCDIYSSTKEVFDILGDNIIPGTIIVFDELYNYPGYKNHEWKALQEYINRKQFDVKFIAFNENHEQIALEIITK